MNKKIKVGIVGLTPGQSWASFAHIPALRSLHEKFMISGVANSNLKSSQNAAEKSDIPNAYDNADSLVHSRDIDLVVVTVRVQKHKAIVEAAIAAGKAIFCEWPIGIDLEETDLLVNLANAKGVKTFVGTQSLGSPAIWKLRSLIQEGFIGKILSQSIIGYGRIWGAEITDEAEEAYLLDKSNGATMLTIPVAHTLAAVQSIFGKIKDVSSLVSTRRDKVFSTESSKYLEMTSPDQVGILATLEDGSILSLHYRGGTAPDSRGFCWEINGTLGVLRVTGETGSIQIESLKIEVCLNDQKEFSVVEIPTDTLKLLPEQFIPGNVARIYELVALDLENGTNKAPDFTYALELHRLIDKIEKSSITRSNT